MATLLSVLSANDSREIENDSQQQYKVGGLGGRHSNGAGAVFCPRDCASFPSRVPDPPSDPRHLLKKDRIVVGWREWIALPDLGVERIKAKVDTGARSSALHAFGMERFRRGGEAWIRFRVHPHQKSAKGEVATEARVIDERRVKSSSGMETLRPVILTTLVWFGEEREIEVTLTRRDAMGFRLLLGREALRRRCLVDPGRSFVGGKK